MMLITFISATVLSVAQGAHDQSQKPGQFLVQKEMSDEEWAKRGYAKYTYNYQFPHAREILSDCPGTTDAWCKINKDDYESQHGRTHPAPLFFFQWAGYQTEDSARLLDIWSKRDPEVMYSTKHGARWHEECWTLTRDLETGKFLLEKWYMDHSEREARRAMGARYRLFAPVRTVQYTYNEVSGKFESEDGDIAYTVYAPFLGNTNSKQEPKAEAKKHLGDARYMRFLDARTGAGNKPLKVILKTVDCEWIKGHGAFNASTRWERIVQNESNTLLPSFIFDFTKPRSAGRTSLIEQWRSNILKRDPHMIFQTQDSKFGRWWTISKVEAETPFWLLEEWYLSGLLVKSFQYAKPGASVPTNNDTWYQYRPVCDYKQVSLEDGRTKTLPVATNIKTDGALALSYLKVLGLPQNIKIRLSEKRRLVDAEDEC